MRLPETPTPVWLPFPIVGAFLIVFPLFWCAVVWLMSQVGDWHRLAGRYGAGDKPVTGERSTGVFGTVGLARYKYVLTCHFTPEGFFLEVMPLFRCGHPRLFIPWSEVSAREPIQTLFWKFIRLSIGNPVVGRITLPADLLERHKH